MKCATHPEIETNLKCGKCGKPICPKCMVQTPVGARCPDCARLYKLPTYRVSTKYYLRAVGTALGMAIVCGVVWGLIGSFVPFFFLNLLLAAGAGYAIGEVVSLSVNRKRGTGLATIAGIAVAISYLVSLFLPFSPLGFTFSLFHILFDLLALALGIYFAVSRLR
ncbi:hypothetical protein ES703_71593 [subsurface metagenome]